MFKKADEVLLHSVKGITDLIMMPGLVNLDFADVKTTMSKAGMAIMGIGSASGENRAVLAAERAISHPLLEDISITGARGVLMNITCTSDLTMEEMTEASDRIYNEVGEDAEIIWGTVVDDSLGEEIRVTLIATGIGGSAEPSGRRPSRRHTSSAERFATSRPRTFSMPRIWTSPPSSVRRKPSENPTGRPTAGIAVSFWTTPIWMYRLF